MLSVWTRSIYRLLVFCILSLSLSLLSGCGPGQPQQEAKEPPPADQELEVESVEEVPVSPPVKPVNPYFKQLGQDIVGANYGDFLGFSLALSTDGKRVLCGAPQYENREENRGYLQIYEWVDEEWSALGVELRGLASKSRLGAVAVMNGAGNQVVVGLPKVDLHAKRVGPVRAYTFHEEYWQWAQLGKDIPGDVTGDYTEDWGETLALNKSGDILAVGNPGYRGGTFGKGQVKAYKLQRGSWQPYGQTLQGATGRSAMGYRVSLNAAGDRLVLAQDKGIQVYQYHQGNWQPLGQMLSTDGEPKLNSKGDILAIGHAGQNNAGQVDVYRYRAGKWQTMGEGISGDRPDDQAATFDLSGDGTRLVIGAWWSDGAGSDKGSLRGQLRIFDWVDGAWQRYGLPIYGNRNYDALGHNVAISSDGHTIAGMLRKSPGHKGVVRLYAITPAEDLKSN